MATPREGEVNLNITTSPFTRSRFRSLAKAMGMTHEQLLTHLIEMAAPSILQRAQKQLEREEEKVSQQREALDNLRSGIRDGLFGAGEEEDDAAQEGH